MGPILDSQGRPVKVSTRSAKLAYDFRTTGMSAGSSGAPQGSTMLSRFAGNNDISKFKKLASDVQTANPSIRSPLLNQSNFYMPESDSSTGEPNRLLNQWITYYLKWHYMCGNIIGLHSTLGTTQILTNKGVKNLSDVSSEDKVSSKSGGWQSVHWMDCHDFSGALYKVRGAGCVPEEYTYNHPILIASGGKVLKKSKDGQTYFSPDIIKEPMWVPAERVKKGDYLIVPKFSETKYFTPIDLSNYFDSCFMESGQRKYDIIEKDGAEYIVNATGTKRLLPRYIPVTEELGEFLGWYVSEGSSNDSTINFSLNVDKDPWERIVFLIKKLFGIECGMSNKGKLRNLCFRSRILSNFLTTACGCGAENKKIPEFIYMNSVPVLKAFMLGYLSGDGFVFTSSYKGGYTHCTTVSKTLAYQLRMFCTKLGFLFNIRENIPKRVNSGKDRPRNDKPIWVLQCSLSQCSEILYGKKVETKTPCKTKQDDRFFYVPVTEISHREYSGNVYDIKTDDHSFTTTFTVHNSELPLSRFALRGISDPTVLRYYEDMAESMSLHMKSVDILKQYFGYGEVIPYAFWSDKYNCFTDMTLLDINYVYVKGHYLLHSEEGDDVEFYELEPDPMLQNLVKSDDYVNQMLAQHLGDEFVTAVRQNKRVLLSNFSTHMIRDRLKYSDLRGTSILLRCLKSLLYSDKLREAQYVLADGNVNPKWLWKIGQAGDLASGGYMPSEDDLTAFRDLLISANNDPLFTIITHYAVNVDAIGLNGKLLPINAELQQIENELLTALFANKAMTTGEGPNYASASVAFRTLMSRYIPVRAKLERYYYQKLFAPVAYANKFYERKQCDLAHNVRTGDEETNKLLIPTIDWRSKSNLLDDGSIKSIIASMVNSGRLPMKMLTETLDLDYAEVRDFLYSEQATVFDPVTLEGRKKLAGANTDETMLGQPFAPKTNQPVSLKAARGQAAPAKAAKASKEPVKKAKFADLLTLKPLSTAVPKDPIQTQIDKGQTHKGVNPEVKDPNQEALKLGVKQQKTATSDSISSDKDGDSGPKAPEPKVFDVNSSTLPDKLLQSSLVGKQFKRHADKERVTVVEGQKEPLKNDFMRFEPESLLTDAEVISVEQDDADAKKTDS